MLLFKTMLLKKLTGLNGKNITSSKKNQDEIIYKQIIPFCKISKNKHTTYYEHTHEHTLEGTDLKETFKNMNADYLYI